jgi:hypothetical protein
MKQLMTRSFTRFCSDDAEPLGSVGTVHFEKLLGVYQQIITLCASSCLRQGQ